MAVVHSHETPGQSSVVVAQILAASRTLLCCVTCAGWPQDLPPTPSLGVLQLLLLVCHAVPF